MLRSVKDLEGYAVGATDGEIGHVKDFYFDDRAWVIRYLVVDAGAWLSSRKVLISPIAIGRPDWTERLLHVWLTKEQVKGSPDIDTDKPVSRQHEMAYSSYYGYPSYWNSANEDPHLRSCREVTKYHIHATDGDIGHVEGMLVDDQTWAIRYLIVDTSNWWLGHQLLIAPQWIENVSWFDSKVSVKMTRQAIKDAPAYDPVDELDRRDEAELYDHYGYPVYWSDEVLLETETSRL